MTQSKPKKEDDQSEFVAPDFTPFVEVFTGFINAIVKILTAIINGVAEIIKFIYTKVKGEDKNGHRSTKPNSCNARRKRIQKTKD